VPEVLLIDTGHPAGLRMIERGAFADPLDPRTALLIECGQHWERAAAEVAMDTLLRFLGHCRTLPTKYVWPQLQRIGRRPSATQQLVRVTEAVVAQSEDFRFVREFRGLEVIDRAGEVIATDGEQSIRTPYAHTVLVMPGMAHLKPGATMVRLGRIEPGPA
jgi:hypothetical protein